MDYALLFKSQPDEERAIAFSRRVMDFSAYLTELGLREPAGFASERRVVYQDACHLLHAQSLRSEPRDLLNRIPNLRLLPIADAGQCCGSAGTYNLDQPALAAELGRRKVESILAAQPDLVASGNIGCITQLRQHLKLQPESPPGYAHCGIALESIYAFQLGARPVILYSKLYPQRH